MFYTNIELQTLGFKAVGKNVFISNKASIYSPHLIEIGDNVRIDDFCILSGNINLKNIDFLSNNKALTYLNCEGNQLTSLDLSNNKELTYLICRGNQLQELDLRSNPALAELYCEKELLKNLNLRNNNSVKINKLNKEEKITFIFSTHDQRVVNKARRVITIEDGKIISDIKKE